MGYFPKSMVERTVTETILKYPFQNIKNCFTKLRQGNRVIPQSCKEIS